MKTNSRAFHTVWALLIFAMPGDAHALDTVGQTDRSTVPAQPGNPPAGGAASDRSESAVERLRETIRSTARKDPGMFVRPIFRETDTEIVYSFGGLNRNLIGGRKAGASPAEWAIATLSSVEAMRNACTTPESKAFWEPYLARSEAVVREQLALLQGPSPLDPSLRARVQSLGAEAERALVEGVEKVAASKSKKAVPAPPSEAWPTPVIYQQKVETITRSVPVITYQTQARTEYRTETVPVARMVTEQVPQTRMRTTYRDFVVFGRRYRQRVQEPFTVMTTQSRQVIENVTRQVPVPVSVQVPVTTTQSVSETVTRQQSRKRVKYKLMFEPTPPPPGVRFYYLPDILYDDFLGRRGKEGDNPEGWKAEWYSILGDSEELWENVVYSLRGYWDIGGEYRQDNCTLTQDVRIPVRPDVGTKSGN